MAARHSPLVRETVQQVKFHAIALSGKTSAQRWGTGIVSQLRCRCDSGGGPGGSRQKPGESGGACAQVRTGATSAPSE
eukprot:1993846-Pyramimonas_sp.AAC.1